MTALLLWLGTGVGAGTLLTEAVHALLHHKTEVTGLLLAVVAWIHRLYANTGTRVTGMPPLPPVVERRPDLTPTKARKEVTA